MAYWWSTAGQYYYTGDQADGADPEVPERPTITSIWVGDHWYDPGPSIETQKATIIQQLKDIDALSIRPLRAVSAGTQLDADVSILADLESQAATLRAQYAALG